MPRVAVALALLAALPVATAAAPSLESCRRALDTEGPSKSVARCYFSVGWETPELLSAAKRDLEEIIESYPRAPWPNYYRGRLPPWWVDGMGYMQRAAELFAADHEVTGEIRARANLVTLHGFQVIDGVVEAELGFAAADAELERLHRLLEASVQPYDDAIVYIAEAHYRLFKGTDLGEAYSLLLDAEEILREAPPQYYPNLQECYRSLIDVTAELDVPWGSRVWALKAEAAARARGSAYDLAAASNNVIEATLRSNRPNPERREEMIARAHETLSLALESGHAGAEGSSRYVLARLEGGPRARQHLERCRRIGIETRNANLRSSCEMALATLTLDSDPPAARRLLEEGYTALGQANWTFLDIWPDQLRVMWETAPLEEALVHGETILAAVESLRRRQSGDATDLLLSEWADPYYWLAGRLLQDSPDADGIRRAFAVLERLRAQTLREALVSTEAPAEDENRERLDQAYVEVYRGLLDPSLSADERQALQRRLSDLERREAELERSTGGAPVLEPPLPDLLDRIQATLGDDEVLLSYQLGMWEGWDRRFLGGSWLTVTGRDGTHVYPLEADAGTLETRVRALLRLEDPERPAALARLHHDLLAPARGDLPLSVRKLIIVPDGFLHLLPFSLLRESEESPPLVADFEIHNVPSASVWLDWRLASAGAERPRQALVLANPSVVGNAQRARARGALDSPDTFGPLPHAEKEGRRVLRHLGGRGRLELRRQASESFLKTVDLSSFDIIHFAAHAISNPEKPGRSAILLAPGSDDEDGFLRPSEIARLQGLEGKLVVLAACDSARGNVLRGEGALSLGRAFFEAGAQSVLASLWRLDDRLATEFFDDFYARLREGVSVGEAFTHVQRAWSAAGRPASIWAGLVVLGDGDFVPLPGGVPPAPDRRWMLAAALVALLIVTGVVLLRRAN